MRKPLFKIDHAIRCAVVKRLNRFVALVIVDGKTVWAYVNNTGRLVGYLKNGKTAFCTVIEKPRRTRYRLFAVEDDGLGTIIDTYLQVKAFESAVELGFIPWLKGCQDYWEEREARKIFVRLPVKMRWGIYLFGSQERSP
jgi:sugar fermentation stimulation protein A